jgi:hypothetical protein
MKPRARRVTLAAVALAAVLVTVLTVTHWATVRDHVQAWHFQLTRETETIQPLSIPARVYMNLAEMTAPRYVTEEHMLRVAADQFRCPVIVDPQEVYPLLVGFVSWNGTRETLEKRGWRFLEQRFPRQAYVVINSDCIVLEPDPSIGFPSLGYPGYRSTR